MCSEDDLSLGNDFRPKSLPSGTRVLVVQVMNSFAFIASLEDGMEVPPVHTLRMLAAPIKHTCTRNVYALMPACAHPGVYERHAPAAAAATEGEPARPVSDLLDRAVHSAAGPQGEDSV